MDKKLIFILFFAAVVSLVWWLSSISIPHKGASKLIERTISGVFICMICHALLAPLGISIPQTPLSALLTGWLGLPGTAFAAFLSALP